MISDKYSYYYLQKMFKYVISSKKIVRHYQSLMRDYRFSIILNYFHERDFRLETYLSITTLHNCLFVYTVCFLDIAKLSIVGAVTWNFKTLEQN